MRNKIFTLFFLVLLCSCERIGGDSSTSSKTDNIIGNERIVNKEQIIENLRGTWLFNGETTPEDGTYMRLNGEIEFLKDNMQISTFGLQVVNTNGKMGSAVCKTSSKWTWYDDNDWDFERKGGESCDCTYKSYISNLTDSKVENLLSMCDKLFGSLERIENNSNLSRTRVKVYKDTIEIIYVDYSSGGEIFINLERENL